MGFLKKLLGGSSEDMEQAEEYIRGQDSLYRDYCMPEVQAHVEKDTGAQISRGQARTIVSKIRNEKGYGPIKDYNL